MDKAQSINKTLTAKSVRNWIRQITDVTAVPIFFTVSEQSEFISDHYLESVYCISFLKNKNSSQNMNNFR